MGQAPSVGARDALDTVITNALIVDYTGIYKADIGIRHGLIHAIGKAGNPDVMAGVTPGMIVGVRREVIACEGLILTAGGIDCHIHFICPQQADEAIASGLTTMVGGGTGPATGTCAPPAGLRGDTFNEEDTDTRADAVALILLDQMGLPRGALADMIEKVGGSDGISTNTREKIRVRAGLIRRR